MDNKETKIFVPTKLNRDLDTPKSKKGGQAALLAVAIIGVNMILYFMTHQYIESTFNIGIIVTALIYVGVTFYSLFFCISIFIYDGRKHLIERSFTKGNKHLKKSLFINLNNKSQDVLFKLDKPTKAVFLKYGSTHAIAFSICNECKEALPSDCDLRHYQSMQFLEDRLTLQGFKVDSITKRYNIENDPIWDYRRDRLRKYTQDYRKRYNEYPEYTKMMGALFNENHEYCLKHSNVEVTYFIVSKPAATIATFTNLYSALEVYGSQLLLINLKEIDTLMASYYGFKDFKTSQQNPILFGKHVNPGLIDYIGYFTLDGHYISLNEDTPINFANDFIIKDAYKKVQKQDTNSTTREVHDLFNEETW